MNTLYITRSNNILIDTENNRANKMEISRIGIDNIYVAKEHMHVVYGVGEYNREFDVEKGDIIITFYPKEYKHQAIVIKSAEWLENLLEYEKTLEEEKLRWAAAKDNAESISRDTKEI